VIKGATDPFMRPKTARTTMPAAIAIHLRLDQLNEAAI
jgi:hypothetical protein